MWINGHITGAEAARKTPQRGGGYPVSVIEDRAINAAPKQMDFADLKAWCKGYVDAFKALKMVAA